MNPLTEFPQILIGELGRTTRGNILSLVLAKLSGLILIAKIKFSGKID